MSELIGFGEVLFEEEMAPEGGEETMSTEENIPDDVEPETPDA